MSKPTTPFRPPIIAVLGHVDHGKTTLLDTIRKTNIAAGEHGGITQHIGAYQVTAAGRLMTFIDTPGHEAFAAMRSRGASAADIAILVVAADDSVKPQTIESIGQIKASGIPMIVVANKVDLPTANLDKVKADLGRNGVSVEGYGGDVPIVAVSAKQGTGVPDLLETILLLWDMKGEAAAAADPLHAVVIETRVDKGQGMVATLIIRKGTLRLSTSMFEGSTLVGKVRAMRDAQDQQVSEAPPGKPVVVLGFTSLPSVGSVITDVPGAATAAAAASKDGAAQARPDFLEPIDPTAVKTLNLVVKADTAGSLEAVADKLTQGVKIVSSGVGDIREADILLAKSAGAIIIGFGVKAPGSVAKLAAAEKVIFRTYTLIYELLDEISDVLSGMETVFAVERELGKGEIIAEFPFDKKRIAGTKVLSGRLAKGDTVKIIRGDEEIGRARIASMRKGKEEATKAEAGTECGVLLDKEVDFTPRDGIIAFTTG